MRMMKTLRAAMAALLALALCAQGLPPASAASGSYDSVKGEGCSLTLEYAPDGEPMANNVFRIWKVATLSEKGCLPFGEIGSYHVLNGKGAWLDKASTLLGYLQRDNVAPTASAATGEDGKVRFDIPAADQGLYLVAGDSQYRGATRYTPMPFLVMVPYSRDLMAWETDVETYSKFTTYTPPPPDKPKPSDEPRPSDDPKVSDEPRPSDDPKVSDEPRPSDDPKVSDGPNPSDGPKVSDGPNPSDDPRVSDGPNPSDDPKVSDGPRPSDDPKVSGEPRPSDDPNDPDDPDGPDQSKTIQRHVLKSWEDDGYEDERPREIVVDLLRDGQVYDTVTITAADNWRCDWTGLDPQYEWTVVERELDQYSVLVKREGITFHIVNTMDEEIDSEDPPLFDAPIDPLDPDDTIGPPIFDDPGEPDDDDFIDDPDIPLDEGPGLPQTGQLWWPVLPMAVGGLALTALGWKRRRDWSASDET